MSRLIDSINKEYALASVCSGLIRTIDGEDWIRVSDVRESIMNTPTIDAVPVEHGHWEKTPIPIEIRNNTTRTYYFKCNKCSSTSWNRNNYCSHCGAKMDKEE